MKSGRIFVISSGVLSVLLATSGAGATPPELATLLGQCDEAEGFASYYAEMQQVITTSSGAKRTMAMRAWAVNNGDKQLSEYLAPADIKGQRILMTDDGDNIWMYNPETRRTRKLGSHMKKRKVMGSDFTYEDQAGGRMNEKYAGRVVGEEDQGGAACWVLELTPTAKGPSYDKIVAWLGKDDHLVRRVDYYEDEGKTPFKRLVMAEIRKVGSKTVPHKMTMTNLFDKTETISIITRIQYGAQIPLSIFESRNLEK